MADLTGNAPLRIWGEAYVETFHLSSSGAQTIYKGHPMLINQSKDTTKLWHWDDGDEAVAATDVFVGIAAEEKSIESGASESDIDSEIEVYVQPTIVGFKSSVFDNADLGKTVYMSDSDTLSETAADNPEIGKLHRVRDGYAYVRLSTPNVCSGA
jgi:hypothetical protein